MIGGELGIVRETREISGREVGDFMEGTYGK